MRDQFGVGINRQTQNARERAFGDDGIVERDAAADTLLAMIAADRAWNEGAARAKLLQIFEVVGLEDAWVAARRRRLSTILFG